MPHQSIWVSRLDTAFQAHADPAIAMQMSAYMRNKFRFYGIKTPQRKAIVSSVWREYGVPQPEDWPDLALTAFQREHAREMQYAVGDLLRPKSRQLNTDLLPLIEDLIQQCSWWDTVDWLAPKLAGRILLENPDFIEPYPDKWIESSNHWLVRSAILFQLDHKAQLDTERLAFYCLRHQNSTEFFIQKAMGWILRTHSRRDPNGSAIL